MRLQDRHGFTLIEVVIVVIIAGILATIAIRSVFTISETGRIEETKHELDDLAYAIAGNPTLENNGVRSDFGYVGDVGAMPPNLDALVSNPGGYSTWNGPYIKRRFEQITADYKQDAWGAAYSYSGVNITSSGSGSSIVRKIANATSDLTRNRVAGNILDRDGTPPGADYKDSLVVFLSIPNGTGGTSVKTVTPDIGGYFAFDSIPIGNHPLTVVYQPTHDTLDKFVSVDPRASVYGTYYLPADVWTAPTGGGSTVGSLVFVTGSAYIYGNQCHNLRFQITNTSGSDIDLSSIQLDWGSPTAYYDKVYVDGHQVVNANSPRPGSGTLSDFNSPRTVIAGGTVVVQITDFRSNTSNGGGSKVNMSGVDLTVTFSDGSVLTFNTGSCN
jgi:general secretion pathway protein G